MKIRTSDLIDAPLDWAVAVARGMNPETARLFHDAEELQVSTTGSEVIDIMEREGIVVPEISDDNMWFATYARAQHDSRRNSMRYFQQVGPTLRIAVCRAFVASKLGDEVEIPDELIPT